MSKWTGCPTVSCKNDLCNERCQKIPYIKLMWAHENDDTLDEYGIFVADKCVEQYEGENQTRMRLAELLKPFNLRP